MKPGLVTIGLPVFNGENFLSDALDSLVAQEYRDIEIVVVDNGSTDSTPQILSRYAAMDERIRVERSDRNRGAAWSFNRTFELARGEYFTWCSHDDVYLPGFISACVDVLKADPGVSVVVSSAAMIDSEGSIIGPIEDFDLCTSPDPVVRGWDIMSRLSRCLHVFGVTRTQEMARTRLIGAYSSSDKTTLFELALIGRFALVPEVLFHNREHPERSMRAHGEQARDREAWFDPARAGRVTLPWWRLLVEYERSLRLSDLGARDRWRLRIRYPLWMLDGRNRTHLWKEAVRAALLKLRLGRVLEMVKARKVR